MVLYAFSTLGKSTLTKSKPGHYWDFAVNRMSKQLGFEQFDPNSGFLVQRLSNVILRSESAFEAIFVSILSYKLARWLSGHTKLLVVLPKYGVNEFKRRLQLREPERWEQTDEWKHLGNEKYSAKIHEIESWCKELHIKVVYADYLSDVI